MSLDYDQRQLQNLRRPQLIGDDDEFTSSSWDGFQSWGHWTSAVPPLVELNNISSFILSIGIHPQLVFIPSSILGQRNIFLRDNPFL